MLTEETERSQITEGEFRSSVISDPTETRKFGAKFQLLHCLELLVNCYSNTD